MLHEEHYSMEPTGSYSSAQNGLAEKPNQDLAAIIRCLLHGAGLGSEYWSYAIRHAVYLKNRRPHTALNFKTLYEMINNKKPNLSHLQIFGAKVHIQSTGKRNAKLDSNNTEGTFMTYSGTDKNIWAINQKTGKQLLATHYSFDEAHMSTKISDMPPYAITIQQAGYSQRDLPTKSEEVLNIMTKIKICRITENANVPTRLTPESAGLDLSSAEDCQILPHAIMTIPTVIALKMEKGTYGQIQPRSGITVKQGLLAVPGVIDSYYRGNLKAIILNTTNEEVMIRKNQKIVQLIAHSIPKIVQIEASTLEMTKRGLQGFGSTEI